jgi:hypothetical protein
VLDQLLEAVRGGASRALVVRGEAGVGKTALLEYLAGRASGCRVVSAAGVQSEMELAFAGLHQFCAPMLDRLETVPAPQREALDITFGLGAGAVPDRFLVGLGVLSLLAEVAAERPLVCVVDDEQWLDRASAQVLLVAAAEPLGDPVLVWRATGRLGIGAAAVRPAAEAGLVEFGARVRFRHPLVRSASYRSASAQDRQAVHRALAEATDPATDPDHRAWHRAQAAPGPDEGVASELERAAGRAQVRGGLAAAAAFLERATVLTPDPAQRAGRALAAARASHHAGAPDRAIAMLTLAGAGPYDPLQQAQVDLLRAQLSLTMTRGGESVSLLLNAARRLEPLDPRLARETYLDALMAAMFAGHLAAGGALTEAARAARAAPRPVHDPLPADLLLDGLAVRFTDGYTAAMPILRMAVAAFDQRDLSPEELRWLWLAHITAGNLWNEQTLDTVHHVDIARGSGALATLPLALATRIGAHVLTGELSAADVLLDEDRHGGDRHPFRPLWRIVAGRVARPGVRSARVDPGNHH